LFGRPLLRARRLWPYELLCGLFRAALSLDIIVNVRALVALLAAAASPAIGSTSRFQLFSAEKEPIAHCKSGELRAAPRCSGAGCSRVGAFNTPWAFHHGSAEAGLALNSDVSWEIQIDGSGCWASPIIVAAGNDGE